MLSIEKPFIKPVQQRLLIPLAVVFLVLVSGYGIILLNMHRRNLHQSELAMLEFTSSELERRLIAQTRELVASQEILLFDADLRTALKARDRERLQANYKDVFTQLREENGITHFYFHLPDRKNLLRVHKPEKYGDLIERFTTLEAEQTGETASGIELGPLGTFTLRVVRPVFDEGTLIGYLELGKEIEDILASIHCKDGIDMAVIIHKNALKRDQWESGMKMLGREADWNRYKKHVMIYSSFPYFPTEYDQYVSSLTDEHGRITIETEMEFDGNLSRVLIDPLIDVSGADVGELFILTDISATRAAFNRDLAITIGLSLALLGGLLGFFYFRLRKIDRAIRRQQAELVEHEEHLSATLRSIGDAVITTDTKGNISGMNPVAEMLTGWTLKEAQGKPFREVLNIFNVRTGKLAEHSNPVSWVIEKGEIQGPANHSKLLAKNGREYLIAQSAAPILAADDNTTGMVLVFRDVTEEYTMRKNMAASEEKFRTMFESSRDAILLFDLREGYLDCNSAALEMFAITSKAELYKLSPSQISPEYQPDGTLSDPNGKEKAERAIKEDSNFFEWQHKDLNGREFPATVLMTRMELGGKIILQNTIRDITERKRAKEEIRRMQKLNSLGVTVGGIAHDFNNLLTGVFSNIELAKNELPENHESNSYLKEANGALKQARRLTGQFLTFSKGGNPVIEIVGTTELLRETVNFNLSGSNIQPRFELPNDFWPIKGDKGQLSQVLANLTLNAKQAMPAGGNLYVEGANVEEAAVCGAPKLSGKCVRLTIRDEGPGISPKIIDKIFDPYFSTKESGNGLGLAVVHSIIIKHGGHISVDSTPDAGTTFTLFLPAAAGVTAEVAEIPKGSPEEVKQPTRKSIHILLMDDEEIIRNIMAKMLKKRGNTVDTASDGKEALEKYTSAMKSGKTFALTIMDLTIPGGMGGKETIKELIKIDPKAKVIVSSGYSSNPVVANYSDYGFSGHLSKPFKLSELEQEILRVMELE